MSYIYEVSPINYFNLAEPERSAVLAGFATSLRQLSSAVAFHVKLDKMSILDGNELCNVRYRRPFLKGGQQLDGFLAAMGMRISS